MKHGNLRVMVVVGLALAMLLTASADASSVVRHSGTVAMVDAQGGILVVDEVGPWRIEHGATVLNRVNITLTPETKYNLFMRLSVPGAYEGDFAEVVLEAEDLSAGDFVTVECRQQGRHLVALTVTVAEMP